MTGPADVLRVTAVVPCFDRPSDLAVLIDDLARLRTSGLDVRVLVVDNGSSEPIAAPESHPMHVRVLRLSVNTGGSGGYSVGMAWALENDEPDLLWLVDSDARIEAGTLQGLADALRRRKDIGIVGPVIADPLTGDAHEIGGRIDRRTGTMGAAFDDVPGELSACDYVAACCLLVRAECVRHAGVFPPVFLNGDDSAWCVRLSKATGLGVAIEPAARATHPRFDGFPTFARYYGSRNALEPMAALGLGAAARFRRGAIESMRAVNCAMTGRGDLAQLHLAGLRDAARGRVVGRGEPPAFERPVPAPESTGDRPPRIEPEGSAAGSLPGLLRRLVVGPTHDEAVLPAKGHPSTWLVARTAHLEHSGGRVTRRISRWRTCTAAAWTLCRGLARSAQLALHPPKPAGLPPMDVALACAPVESAARSDGPLSLSVIVLSYNRRDALLETLDRLRAAEPTAGAEIVVVDNASTDGTVEAVRAAHPGVTLVANERNELIEGFNAGVREATGDLVLILDDDARPDPEALAEAVDAVSDRPELGGATLHPVHPATGEREWPFADSLREPTDGWPVMGCCNLVRRSVWIALGGYDARFGLYRNDVDMAMRILASGLGVRFDPAWTCEHDSPAAARKSVRWCERATRNWVWLCRRHGALRSGMMMATLGWLSAHRHAGPRLAAQLAVLKGLWHGIATSAPMPGWWRRDDRGMHQLLRLRLARRGRAQASSASNASSERHSA